MKSHSLALRARGRDILGIVPVSLMGLIFLAPVCFSVREESLDHLLHLRHRLFTDQRSGPQDIPIVFINDGAPGEWKPYIELVKRLEEWKAKAVVFDLVFTNDRWRQDFPKFANAVNHAVTNAGLRFVFASEAKVIWTNGIPQYREVLLSNISDLVTQLHPNAAIGLASLQPHRPDGVVRLYSNASVFDRDPLALAAVRLLTNTNAARARPDWINYYGPPGSFTNYESKDIVEGSESLRSVFEAKVVFVGQGPAVTNRQPLLDRHETPFTRSTTNTSSGVEIHATAYANVMRGDRIRDLSGFGEGLLVLLVGLVAGINFVKWTPQRALTTAVSFSALVSVSALLLFLHTNSFFPWLIIAAVQLPTAFAVSLLPMRSAFICYRSLDGDKAAFLIADGLKRLGVEVYMDIKGSQPGELECVLLPEVEKRGNFVVVVTPALFTGWEAGKEDWVGEEIARALQSHKPILPVYVGGVSSFIPTEEDAGGREEQSNPLPVYDAIHSAVRFSLYAVVGRHIREADHLDRHDSSIEEIVSKLRRGLRKNWGKQPGVPSHAKPIAL